MKAIPLHLKTIELQVLSLLQENRNGLVNAEVAKITGRAPSNTHNRLKRLVRKGLASKSEHNVYQITSKGVIVVLRHLTNTVLGYERPLGAGKNE